jgi:hypothetical protein
VACCVVCCSGSRTAERAQVDKLLPLALPAHVGRETHAAVLQTLQSSISFQLWHQALAPCFVHTGSAALATQLGATTTRDADEMKWNYSLSQTFSARVPDLNSYVVNVLQPSIMRVVCGPRQCRICNSMNRSDVQSDVCKFHALCYYTC